MGSEIFVNKLKSFPINSFPLKIISEYDTMKINKLEKFEEYKNIP